MTATLAQLIQVRSQLAEEVLAYLNSLAARTAELPKYYPPHLRRSEAGRTPFDDIRQIVQVVADRSAFEKWVAEERERMRAAGQDYDRIAYKPQRSLLEVDEKSDGERHYARHDRPAPPPPFQWDEQAGSRFKRAVILGDPGFGKTWLLRYEARRLARVAAEQVDKQTCGLEEITLPIFMRLSELNRSDGPLEDALIDAVSTGRSAAFRHLVREKLGTERCVILLDAWDEVPVETTKDGQPLRYEAGYRQRLGQRLDAFARQFTQPRLLMTSRIVGYDQSPLPDMPQTPVKELELLAFDTPQIEAFVRVWFGEGNDAAQQFLAMLRQNHQVRGLARIPLMLTLMCRAYQEKQLAFPTRRLKIYDHCLRGLLRDWKEEKMQCEIGDGYVDALLELLRTLAFDLFARGYEFTESLLRAKMLVWLRDLGKEHEFYNRNPSSLIAELKHDGVFIRVEGSRNPSLCFLHSTFHEHLAKEVLRRDFLPTNSEFSDQVFTSGGVVVVDKRAVKEHPGVILALEEYFEQAAVHLQVSVDQAAEASSLKFYWYDPEASSPEEARESLIAFCRVMSNFANQYFGAEGYKIFRLDPHWFSKVVYGDPEAVAKQLGLR